MQQFQLPCKIHPEKIVAGICILKDCKYPSRLACFTCMANKSINEYENCYELLSNIDSMIHVLERDYQENQITSLLKAEQFDLEQQIEQNITHIIESLTKFKENLNQHFKPYNELKALKQSLQHQYFKELQNLNQDIINLSSMKDPHKHESWTQMEESISKYILQFYQPDNQEIKETISRLEDYKPEFNNQQEFEQSMKILKEECDDLFTQISQIIPRSQLISRKFISDLVTRICAGKPQKSLKLVYKGSRDGFQCQKFWDKIQNLSSLLLICKSKSGSVFGGYSPCKWECNNKWQMDPSHRTFLFSATREQIYPMKQNTQHSIYCQYNYGPIIGNEHEFEIGSNFKDGHSRLQNKCFSTDQYKVDNIDTHLMGGLKPDLEECEVIQIN